MRKGRIKISGKATNKLKATKILKTEKAVYHLLKPLKITIRSCKLKKNHLLWKSKINKSPSSKRNKNNPPVSHIKSNGETLLKRNSILIKAFNSLPITWAN